jgi:hypothetical protein
MCNLYTATCTAAGPGLLRREGGGGVGGGGVQIWGLFRYSSEVGWGGDG